MHKVIGQKIARSLVSVHLCNCFWKAIRKPISHLLVVDGRARVGEAINCRLEHIFFVGRMIEKLRELGVQLENLLFDWTEVGVWRHSHVIFIDNSGRHNQLLSHFGAQRELLLAAGFSFQLGHPPFLSSSSFHCSLVS